jgi:parvulin-like peptidyl-prolyl isomerase
MLARKALAVAATLGMLALPGTGSARAARDEPDVVVVQHILIAFKGSVRGKRIERTKKEARALAEQLLDKVRAGDEDFDALVKQHTDDSYPGTYKLTNRDAPRIGGAFQRTDMVPAFGDVAFSLEVGEVGMAEYSAAASPFGWHIIKRLE